MGLPVINQAAHCSWGPPGLGPLLRLRRWNVSKTWSLPASLVRAMLWETAELGIKDSLGNVHIGCWSWERLTCLRIGVIRVGRRGSCAGLRGYGGVRWRGVRQHTSGEACTGSETGTMLPPLPACALSPLPLCSPNPLCFLSLLPSLLCNRTEC